MGLVALHRRDLNRAEVMFRATLEINEEHNWLEGVAKDSSNLARVLLARAELAKLEEAERLEERALAIYTQFHDIPGMANSSRILGTIYLNRGKLEEAEECFNQALQLEDQLGRSSEMAQTNLSLGELYRQKADLEQAEQCFRRALKIRERLGDSEALAVVYKHLGLLYRDRGDLVGAEAMWSFARKVDPQPESVPEPSPDTA